MSLGGLFGLDDADDSSIVNSFAIHAGDNFSEVDLIGTILQLVFLVHAFLA